jgi:Bifunctional DNA primase/polymerase, N-terminal
VTASKGAATAAPALLEAALEYAAADRPVFPVRSDKKPLTEHAFKDASPDEATIRAWWARWPDGWIGVPTGADFFVLDVDNRRALVELETEHGFLPDTRRASTPRGGIHFYFAGQARTGNNVPLAGIDIRGYAGTPRTPGGFVIVPPSPGYIWEALCDLVEPPSWLMGLLEQRTVRARHESQDPRQMTVDDCARVAERGLDGKAPADWWVASVRHGFEDGQVSTGDGRKLGLCRLVGHLIRRGVDARLAREVAYLVNTRNRPPLPERDVERVCEWVALQELRKRGVGK